MAPGVDNSDAPPADDGSGDAHILVPPQVLLASRHSGNGGDGDQRGDGKLESRQVDPAPVPHGSDTFAIIVLVDDGWYPVHRDTAACYAARHGYTFVADANAAAASQKCGAYGDFFYRKHCRAAEIAEGLDVAWVLVLDGDTFVVNASTPLTTYTADVPPTVFVLHYERCHNGEVAAGNYMFRNVPAARDYLQKWAAWESRHGPNHDNGAIHLHLLATLYGADSLQVGTCDRHFSDPSYTTFLMCTKCLLGALRVFPDRGVRILRRSHAFARDFFMVMTPSWEGEGVAEANIGNVVEGDPLIFMHGWKGALDPWYSTPPPPCATDPAVAAAIQPWDPPIKPEKLVSMSAGAALLRSREAYDVARRQPLVTADVGDCWPACPPDLTPEQGAALRAGTCPPAGIAL